MSIKEKTDITISIIVIVLAMGFILYYSNSGDGSFLESNEIEHETLENIELEGTNYTLQPLPESIQEEIEEQELDQIIETESTLVDTTFSSLGSNQDDSEDVKSDLLTSDLSDLDTSQDTLENESNYSREFYLAKDTITDADTVSDQEEVKIHVTEIISESDKGNCIILVGSFSQKINANKLKTKLVNAGYDIFEIPFENLERVGVYVSCKDDVLNKQLEIIQEKIAKDARVYIQE